VTTSRLGAAEPLRAAAIARAQARRARRARITPADRATEGRGRTALVTGASAGIGRAMAQLLAAKGYDIVVIARREEQLAALAAELEQRWGVTALPIACDLGRRAATAEICEALRRNDTSVDVLVNNAGYVDIGEFTTLPWATHEAFIQALGVTPIELCWQLLPSMVERGWGRIINVASVSALFAGSPSMVLYSSVKSMLLKFTEGLAVECAPSGVHCTVSIPGVTASEFFDRNRMSAHFAGHLAAQHAAMCPEDVAREAYAASMAGRRVIVHGRQHKLATFLCVHAPAPVRYAASRSINSVTVDPR